MMLCNADATRPASVTAFLAAFDSESTDEGSQYGRPLFTVHLHVDYCMLQWLHAPHVAMRLTTKRRGRGLLSGRAERAAER